MYITKLYIRNFRNIGEAELELDKNLNIFVGRNAQGKTNIFRFVWAAASGVFVFHSIFPLTIKSQRLR